LIKFIEKPTNTGRTFVVGATVISNSGFILASDN